MSDRDKERQSSSTQEPRSPLPSQLAADHAEQLLAGEIDNIVPTRGYHSMPVVGLGGSAGSINALQIFLKNTPSDTGMAFVVVLHLSPEHESSLPAILQRQTAMRVIQVQQKVKAERNCVYVIAPGKHLSMADGSLHVSELEQERGKRVAVDLFFRTLADTHGPHSIAVILSGVDGDGSIGIKRIKERGGLTIVQEPGEAEQDGMPRSAIATGMVDWVLPVGEMPKRIVEFVRNEARLRLPSEEGPQPAREAINTLKGNDPESENALREVLAFLRMRT